MQASWHSMGPSAIEIVRPAARALLTLSRAFSNQR